MGDHAAWDRGQVPRETDPVEIDPVEQLRKICLALPETTERLSHGEPSFFIRDKKQFVSLDDHHHSADHLAFWCPAPPGAQDQLIAEDSEPLPQQRLSCYGTRA
jgi:hypothetical protein